jgi:putative transcription factor
MNTMHNHQDWTTIYFHKKPDKTTQLRDGHTEAVEKVSGAAREYSDRARKLESDINTAPTDAAPPPPPLPRLSAEARQALIQARTARKMTQTQLAQTCCTQSKIVQDLETGKVIEDKYKGVLQKVNKVLGTKLRYDQ